MASSSSRKSNSSASRAPRVQVRRDSVAAARNAGARFASTRSGVRTGERRPVQSGAMLGKRGPSRGTVRKKPTRRRSGTALSALSGTAVGKILAVAAVVAIVGIVVGIVVSSSGVFAATDIQIQSSEHVSKKDARALIGIPAGTSLLNVDEKKIGEGLEQNPWVDGVTIEKRYPHTLVITPSEKKVAAIVYLSSEDLAWAVGEDRTWIAPITLSVTVDKKGKLTKFGTTGTETPSASSDSSDTDDSSSTDGSTSTTDSASGTDSSDSTASDGSSDDATTDASDASESDDDASTDVARTNKDGSQVLTGRSAARAIAKHHDALLLTDVPSDIKPDSGKAVSSRVVSAGLDYAAGFSSSFRSQIKEMSIASREAISCTLTSGVEISLGSPSEINKKERVVTQLLEQERGVTYINVRTPGSYTYRSVSGS